MGGRERERIKRERGNEGERERQIWMSSEGIYTRHRQVDGYSDLLWPYVRAARQFVNAHA